MASSKETQTVAHPAPPPPKAMSSNLMTMKFMQRAAASQSQKSTPIQSTPDVSEPPSKRRKTDTRTPDYGRAEALARSPATPLSDIELMKAATAEEEAKREKAIERLATEAGETKWVLSSTGEEKVDGERGLIVRLAKAGYGEIDEGDGRLPMHSMGRRSFGKFSKADNVRHNG